MSDTKIWRLYPWQFEAMWEEYNSKLVMEYRRQQQHFGLLAYFLANGLFKRDRPMPLSDFMPSEEKERPARQQTAEEQIAIMKQYMMIYRANKKAD